MANQRLLTRASKGTIMGGLMIAVMTLAFSLMLTPQFHVKASGSSYSVAYIYASDSASAHDFQNFITSYGITVDLITNSSANYQDYSGYNLIIIGGDTWNPTMQVGLWSPVSAVSVINDSGKPIMGIFEGGGAFFDNLTLDIGWEDAGYNVGNEIRVVNATDPIFTQPISITIPPTQIVQLYNSNTEELEVYAPTQTISINIFGQDVDNKLYSPLIMESNRYFLWGFRDSPSNMTQTGRNLFANIVSFLTGDTSIGTPSAPQSLQAIGANGQVNLSWTASATSGAAEIVNYRVYRGTGSGQETLLATVGNVMSYFDSTVTNGVTYYYQVSAVNSVGEGSKSVEITATPTQAPKVPVSSAFIDVYNFNDSSGNLTETSGSYSVSLLKPGTYTLIAEAQGYLNEEVDNVVITGGNKTTVNFDLQLSGAISGTVTDAVNGSTLKGAYIEAETLTGTEYFSGNDYPTGTDGKYFLGTNLGTGFYNVSITRAGIPPGYMEASQYAGVTAGKETKNVNFALARSGTISGRVAAPNGTGLPHVEVLLYVGNATSGFEDSETDSSGNYAFNTDLSTGNYTLHAEGYGNFTEIGTVAYVTSPNKTSNVNIELTPVPTLESGIITGRVTDTTNGTGISRADVEVSGLGGDGINLTDADGYYSISSYLITGSDYNVTVSAPGYNDAYYPANVTVVSGQTTSGIDIQMSPIPLEMIGTLIGTVTGPAVTIPEFQNLLIAMLSLTVVAAVTGRLIYRMKRSRKIQARALCLKGSTFHTSLR